MEGKMDRQGETNTPQYNFIEQVYDDLVPNLQQPMTSLNERLVTNKTLRNHLSP